MCVSNGLHVSVRLFNSVTIITDEVKIRVLLHFDVVCDMLLNRRTTTQNRPHQEPIAGLMRDYVTY